ncbi:hypothetical protein SSX86_025488 [Deinandra increscens subsp. villosa]|uniref:Oleosin n=1 Tax=Deinandra increscens subsp. villosa TaxID=3103831 RepID=A0AAP0CI11_9ASTR
MADRHKAPTHTQHHLITKQPKPTTITHGSGPTRLMGLMALLVSTAILLVLTATTVTTAVIGFILFAPVIIITSPIWVPAGVFLLFSVAAVLSVCGLGLAAAAVLVVQVFIKETHG